MTTSKWALRLGKLVIMTTLLVGNTGLFRSMINQYHKPRHPDMVFYDSIRGLENGISEQIRREGILDRYILAKGDSVQALVESGHGYSRADYFRDLRDVYGCADTTAPWNRHSLSLSVLLVHIDGDGGLTQEEVDEVQRAMIGSHLPTHTVSDWNLGDWLLRQYLLGLLPALLMFLILARQGRIGFSLKKSPISSLLYLALWPINLGLRVIVAFQDIDREARLRTQKDFLFSRLSGLEEGFLESLRNNSRGEELLSTKRVRLSYLCAIVAVLIMKVVPVVAQAVPETGHNTTIEVAYHDPPSTWSDDTECLKDPMCNFAFVQFILKANRRIVWWSRYVHELLVGFDRSIDHVPLGGTA